MIWGDGHPKRDNTLPELGDTGHPKRDPLSWPYETEDAENRLREKLEKEGYGKNHRADRNGW